MEQLNFFHLYANGDDARNFITCEKETSTMQHIRSSRGSGDGVTLNFQIDTIDSREYLMNACAYVLVQPTKDGKAIMPYDYKWGTGSMYFRFEGHISPWRISKDGGLMPVSEFGQLSYKSRKNMGGLKWNLPDS